MAEQLDQTKTPSGKKGKTIFALVALVVFAGAVFLVTKLANNANKPPQPTAKSVPVAAVRITKTGFEPSTLSVKQGTKIVWTNTDSGLHQVVANPYPKGTDLTSLKSEILNNSQSYTYVANTTGNFGYHDQLQPTINGTLVVQKQ
jgi:plastocyanin